MGLENILRMAVRGPEPDQKVFLVETTDGYEDARWIVFARDEEQAIYKALVELGEEEEDSPPELHAEEHTPIR